MFAECANSRPKYTDNEISKIFHDTRLRRNDSIRYIANKYDTEDTVIEYIDQGKYKFSMKMFEIASDYLEIPISELCEVLVDENVTSCRGIRNPKAEALIDMVNILFNEMIMQEKLSL